jgi:hypothetical protein
LLEDVLREEVPDADLRRSSNSASRMVGRGAASALTSTRAKVFTAIFTKKSRAIVSLA